MILSRRRNQGSSPRGRGKPVLRKLARILPRLIPAWAGKTRWRGWKSNPARAHPRVGGENASQVRIICVGAGSSPRGRGKPPYSTVASVRLRLIPAWAGKTLSPRRRGRARAAHPRVGGENLVVSLEECTPVGSSPRGRGKPAGGAVLPARPGLIPAWAGKTSAPTCQSPRPRAHPRVGGENPPRKTRALTSSGSSPRGRGKRRKP